MPRFRKYRRRAAVKAKKPLARKVAKLARKVNNMPVPELKYTDTERLAGSSVGFDLDVIKDPLVLPVQGDSNIQRDGASLTMRKLHIKGRLTANTVQGEPATVRLVLLQAKQRYVPSNTATSGVTQLFEDANTEDAPFSMFSFTNRIHYRVLRDWLVVVQDYGTGAVNMQQRFFELSYTFKKFNKNLTFDAGTTTAQKNQVYLCVISTSGVANYPTIEYVARTTYYDN